MSLLGLESLFKSARKPAAPAAAAVPPLIEGLEGRRLLSASLVNGVLTVSATPGPDRVELDRVGTDRLRVRENGRDRFFSYSAVQRVVVNTFAGDDEIRIEEEGFEAVNKPTQLSGGDGHDRIDGGPNADTIYGGNGNDRLDGNGGNDTVFAGAGNDEVRGGSGNDVLHGEAGHDEIDGDGGSDQLFGGDGDDDLKGGAGADRITGGAGNDDFDDEDAASEILDRSPADAGGNRT